MLRETDRSVDSLLYDWGEVKYICTSPDEGGAALRNALALFDPTMNILKISAFFFTAGTGER